MDSELKRIAAARIAAAELATRALWLIIDSVDGMSKEDKADLNLRATLNIQRHVVIYGKTGISVQVHGHIIVMKVLVEATRDQKGGQ